VKITLNPKEASWIAGALHTEGKFFILYHFYEKLLKDPETHENDIRQCLEYFKNFSDNQYYGLDQEIRLKLVIKTLVETIVLSKKQNVIDSALTCLIKISGNNLEVFTRDSNFTKILTEDLYSLMQKTLTDPRSDWYKQEACIDFFINESCKYPEKIMKMLHSIINTPNMNKDLVKHIVANLEYLCPPENK